MMFFSTEKSSKKDHGMRITPDLQAARADLVELGGYLLILTPQNRAFLDKQGAAIERRWRGLPVYVICDRERALALGRSRDQLDSMDAVRMTDESKLARLEDEAAERRPAASHA